MEKNYEVSFSSLNDYLAINNIDKSEMTASDLMGIKNKIIIYLSTFNKKNLYFIEKSVIYNVDLISTKKYF